MLKCFGLKNKTYVCYQTRGYKKLGTEIHSFTHVLLFTIAKISFTQFRSTVLDPCLLCQWFLVWLSPYRLSFWLQWLHVSIHGTTFSLLFSKVYNLYVLGLGLGPRVNVWVTVRFLVWGLPFMFSMFLPSLLHSRCALLSRYRRWSNKVSNMKNHRRFCSHCLKK